MENVMSKMNRKYKEVVPLSNKVALSNKSVDTIPLTKVPAFRDQFCFLSNMHRCTVGDFTNVEAAFMSQKDLSRSSEFIGLTGQQAKVLGKRVTLRDDWDIVKLGIMEECLRTKFSDPILRDKLCAIQGNIVERNYWSDTYWGECKGIGLNHLGKLLMKIRDELLFVPLSDEAVLANIPSDVEYLNKDHLLKEVVRYTPEHITSLLPNEVFVFGSNAKGIHGKGAAKQAMKFGAVYGQAEGMQGQSYAIITKKDWRVQNSSSLPEIKAGIITMLDVAKAMPDKTFIVVKLGCNLGGYTVKEVAQLFSDLVIPSNVVLPKEFKPSSIRVLIAGGRDFTDYKRVEQDFLKLIEPLDITGAVIVSGMARGADALGVRLAQEYQEVSLDSFPANWDLHGTSAGFIRNQEMSDSDLDYALIYHDGTSRGTQNMLDILSFTKTKVIVNNYPVNKPLFEQVFSLPIEEANNLLNKVSNECFKAQSTLSTYYGTADYVYSGAFQQAAEFPKYLKEVAESLETSEGLPKGYFNMVLVNKYLSGKGLGRHRDNEAEITPLSTIASVSLGAARVFSITKGYRTSYLNINLKHGDVVMMRGKSQIDYYHAVERGEGVRYNLTFRHNHNAPIR